MKRFPWKSIYFLSILSFIATVCLKNSINEPTSSLSYTNSIASFFLFSSWLYVLYRLAHGEIWHKIQALLTPSFIFMLCFAGGMIFGARLDRTGSVDFTNWTFYFSILWISVAAAPVLAAVLHKLKEYGSSMFMRQTDSVARRQTSFFLTWGILFLSYVPTLLASFPGFFSYDAEAETYMVFTGKYSTYQPLLHVLLLGWTLRILYHFFQSYNAGILVFILIQMAILSACFAYEISFLRSAGVKRWICNLGTVFLALFPTVSMFVCCSTKDTLFSGGVVLFTTLLLEMAKDETLFWQTWSKKLLFSIAMLLILFFRNNGIYALVVFLFFFALIHRKAWKKWLPTVGITFLLFITASQSLIWAFHAKKGPVAEMLCVPMQQLARAYRDAGDTLPEEDLEVLYRLIPQPVLEQYNPKLADTVKVNFLEDNFKASPPEYISLWLRTGLSHLDIYINSFLENTYGYWYPDTVLDGYRGIWIIGRQYKDSSYFSFVTEPPGVRSSLLPALEKFYEKVSLEIYQQKLPVISMLFSPGFWTWAYLFAALYLRTAGYKKQLFSLSLIGLLYLTVLLGPIALVRYVLYLFFAVPLLLALLFDPVSLCAKPARAD